MTRELPSLATPPPKVLAELLVIDVLLISTVARMEPPLEVVFQSPPARAAVLSRMVHRVMTSEPLLAIPPPLTSKTKVPVVSWPPRMVASVSVRSPLIPTLRTRNSGAPALRSMVARAPLIVMLLDTTGRPFGPSAVLSGAVSV
jgi:hypothetical protein